MLVILEVLRPQETARLDPQQWGRSVKQAAAQVTNVTTVVAQRISVVLVPSLKNKDDISPYKYWDL